MKVVLVRQFGKPVSVGAGSFCFEIKGDHLVHNEASRAGAEFTGKMSTYDEAWELANLGWDLQDYDEIEEH